MGNFEQAINWLRKGKVIVDNTKNCFEDRFFLFSDGEKIYYILDKTINEDKKKLAVKSNNIPNLIGGDWVSKSWEIYEEKKIKAPGVFIERAALCTIEGIRALCGTDEEYSEYVRKVNGVKR